MLFVGDSTEDNATDGGLLDALDDSAHVSTHAEDEITQHMDELIDLACRNRHPRGRWALQFVFQNRGSFLF